jgi:hypothetical protein
MVRSLLRLKYPKTEDESNCLQPLNSGHLNQFNIHSKIHAGRPFFFFHGSPLVRGRWKTNCGGPKVLSLGKGGLLWICQRPCGSRVLGTTLLRFNMHSQHLPSPTKLWKINEHPNNFWICSRNCLMSISYVFKIFLNKNNVGQL